MPPDGLTRAAPSTHLRTQAVLLRAVDHGTSAHRVITLLTATQGKVTAIALGAQGSKQRFGASLQSCALLDLQLRSRPQGMWRLESAEMYRPFLPILADLSKITAAHAGLSLVREVAPSHQPEPELFKATIALFEQLAEGPEPAEHVLLAFQLRVIALCGLAPQLQRCGRCGRAPQSLQPAAFDAESGTLCCRSCGGAPWILSAATRQQLQRAATSEWRQACDWSTATWQEAAGAVKAFLQHRLTHQPGGAASHER